MPELPEVETIRRALEPMLVGRVINSIIVKTNTLRTPLDQKLLNKELKNREIISLKRRAKYLLFTFSGSKYLLSHLGMTGSYRIERSGFEVKPHDRVIVDLDDGDSLVYNDIRKFGEFKIVDITFGKEFPDKFDLYAPEPLSNGFTGEYLFNALARISAPIKVAIMRQELTVGVGNIYASESLFASKISPLRPANSLTKNECRLLVREIKKVLLKSLESGGTTISDYKRPDGSEGKFALSLKVYGRAGQDCKRRGCTGKVSKITQTGRSTFYCDKCQK